MTEQEFRQALKTTVGDAGLSPYRQQQVLAQMKGEERTVRTSHKMKIALILAAVMLFGSTAALAAGMMNLVNWDGTTSETNAEGNSVSANVQATPQPNQMQVSQEELYDRINELLNTGNEGEGVYIFHPTDRNVASGYMKALCAHSEEEARKLIEASQLPWPEQLPEGYTFTMAWVDYLCSAQSSYECISREMTDVGLQVEYYRIPEGYAVMQGYQLLFEDSAGHTLSLDVSLYHDTTDHYFYIGDYDHLEVITVPGMDDAMYLNSGNKETLRMRRCLDEWVLCLEMGRSPYDNKFEIAAYSEIMFNIYADALSLQELESIFAK